MNPLHVQESETAERVFVIQTCIEGFRGKITTSTPGENFETTSYISL
jgi:hypothetical protein